LDDDEMYSVDCGNCAMRGPAEHYPDFAEAAWNKLPRRPDYNDVDCAGCPERRRGYLTWTTEPPKVEGWYWRKETAKDRAHVFHFTGNWEDYGEHWESDRVCPLPLNLNGNLWAGPIPEPLELEES
jgi:hypothetical protein